MKHVSENRIRGAAHPGEKGSALIYILIAIALLAALTVSFMEPSSQQGQSQSTFRAVSDISSQVEFVRAAVQECVLSYPAGDDSISVTGDEPNANEAYPINPNSGHFGTATIGPTGNRNVRGIRCPGNPGDNDENHTLIFSAASGKFMPPPPPLFGEWQWYNDTDGVFFWISSNKSDAYIRSALEKLDETYAECESDLVDASGGDISLVSDDASVICPNGSLCFRIWMIARPSGNYNGDTNNDESAAGC